jgi:hypothetical protein
VLPFGAQNPFRDSLSERLVDLSTDIASQQLTDEISGLGLRAARAFDHVFPGLDRIAAVLAVDDAFNRLAVLVGVAVNDPGPAVDPDNRDDAVVLVGEGVDLLRPWIQALLRNRDQEGGHLCVRDLALECGCLEDCGQFAESGIASFADVIPQFGNRPVQCLDFLSGTPVCAMLF